MRVLFDEIITTGFVYFGVIMNKDELIKLGLSSEQAVAVLELLKPSLGAMSKLDAVNDELEKARETIAERNNQIDGLKSAQGDANTLRKQIALLQEQNAAAENKYKAELLASRKSYAVRQALLEAEQKPQNVKIVMEQLDLDKVFIDDNGNLTGFQEQQARLVKEAPYLFKSEQAQPQVKNGFSVHGASEQQSQTISNENNKKHVAGAEFGRKLAAVTLQSQGITLNQK